MLLKQIDAAGNKITAIRTDNRLVSPEQLAFFFFCDPERNRLVGDMLAIFSPHDEADMRADFWNPDLTREHICGNGIRCAPAFVGNLKRDVNVFCLDGMHSTSAIDERHTEWKIPIANISILYVPQKKNSFLIDLGTLHIVEFCESHSNLPLPDVRCQGIPCTATKVATSSRSNELVLRVNERGVGETSSCGSAAVSSAIAYHIMQKKPVGSEYVLNFTSGEILMVKVERCHVRLLGTMKIVDEVEMNFLDVIQINEEFRL